MNKPKDWNNVKPATSEEKETITPGGHGCMITNAEQIFKDFGNGPVEMLRLEIEIKEGGPLDGFYSRQMKKKLQYNPNAAWSGFIERATLDKDGNDDRVYKGLITSIEESNPPYSFERAGFDEKTLINKRVGFVFRDEPFTSTKGEVVHYVKPAWACSYDKVNEQPIPPAKAVRGPKPGRLSAQLQEASDDDCPF